MRNEIYNRIKQNKIRYYAELNNLKDKGSPVVKAEEQKPEVNVPVREKQPKEKNVLLKKVQEFDYKSMFKKVPDVVKSGYNGTVKSKAMSALKTQVKNDHEKIMQYSIKVNQKINRQSDKLADGIYNVSSFLFEELNENNSNSLYSNGSLVIEAERNNSVEWNVENENTASVSAYEKLGEFSEKVFDQLRSVPGKINNYLASDMLPEPNDAHMIARK
jgi:hypothetical protein